MNPEEIYNSIKKTSADIQNLSKLDSSYDEIKKERDCTSQDSGIQSSMHDIRSGSPDMKIHGDVLNSPRTDRRRQQYNPSYYQDDVSQLALKTGEQYNPVYNIRIVEVCQTGKTIK